MGWKSTLTITKDEAIDAILASVSRTPYEKLSNQELNDLMSLLNIGDDISKPYFGHNFNIVDNEEERKRFNEEY